MVGKKHGPKADLIVDRPRTSRELQEMIDQLSVDARLDKNELGFLEQIADTFMSSLTQYERNKLEEIHKKYNN